MHRFMVLYPPQVDPQRFRDYYTQTHAPLAMTLPGAKNISYGFDLAALNGGDTWACVFSCDFDNEAAMGACMGSEIGRKVAEDVPNFANPPPMLFHFPVTTG